MQCLQCGPQLHRAVPCTPPGLQAPEQPEATPAVSHRDRPLWKEDEDSDYWDKQL